MNTESPLLADVTRPSPGSTHGIRRRLRAVMPDQAFEANPWRALWFVPLVFAATTSMWVIATGTGDIGVTIFACLVAGNVYASMLLLAHEVMHGAVVRSRRGQYWLSWLGFAPFFISPSLWRVWHNELHHGVTNRLELDPDVFADEDLYKRSRASRFIIRLVPGSGGLLSAFFPFVWFAAQGQIVLWILSRLLPGFERLPRGRAIAEVAAMLGAWCLIASAFGGMSGALAVIVPMAIGNAILMAFIATNHMLRPLAVGDEDVLATSMSVRTPFVFDKLHFRFSHHVEHHLFPAISGRYLPLVRAWLEEHEPDRFVCPPHFRALVYLYRTPRTYRDFRTVVDAAHPDLPGIDLVRLADQLRDPTPRSRRT
jgi:fatty acid desaturase